MSAENSSGLHSSWVDALLGGASELQVCRNLGIVPSDLAQAIRELRVRAESDTQAAIQYEQLRAIRSESARRAAEGRLQALMDISPEAVLVVDGTSGQILMANDLSCRLFGYPVNELVGVSVEDLVPSQYKKVHAAYRINFMSNIRKREMGYHPPIFARRKDGSEVEVAIALTTSPGDDSVMVVCTEYARWNRLSEDQPSEKSASE